jgi:phage-related protein
MPFNTFAPPLAPSPGTQNAPEVKILEATFGDGYTQAQPDGLNNIRVVATLTWSVLLPDQADPIVAFFQGQKGSIPFYYALRDGVTRKFTCKAWTRTWDTPNQVTATLREYFGADTT